MRRKTTEKIVIFNQARQSSYDKHIVEPSGDYEALRNNTTTTITEKISYTDKNYKQDA